MHLYQLVEVMRKANQLPKAQPKEKSKIKYYRDIIISLGVGDSVYSDINIYDTGLGAVCRYYSKNVDINTKFHLEKVHGIGLKVTRIK